MGRAKGSNAKWAGQILSGCEVLDPIVTGKTGSMDKWSIRCSCGNIFVRCPAEVKREPNSSCGCLKLKITRESAAKKKIDYRGYLHKESNVLILEPVDPLDDRSGSQWFALCPHHEVPVRFQARPNSIRTNHTRSCGCLFEIARADMAKNQPFFEQRRIERGLNKDQYIVQESILIRESLFKPIRHLAFKRDHYKCRRCGDKPDYVNAHHIFPLNTMSFNDPKSLLLSYDLKNIITLCRGCHSEAHNFDWQDIDLSLQQHYLELIEKQKVSDEILVEYLSTVKEQIEPWLGRYLLKSKVARDAPILV